MGRPVEASAYERGRKEENEQTIKDLKWLKRRLEGHSDGEVVSMDYVEARIDDLLSILDKSSLPDNSK